MKIIGAALAGAMILSFSPSFAAIGGDDAVATACPASADGSTPLSADCVKAVCDLVNNSFDSTRAAQQGLGSAIGALISKSGDADAAAADSIQSCVAKGPKRLIAGYEGEVPTSVADIGKPKDASAH